MDTQIIFYDIHRINVAENQFSVDNGPWITLNKNIDETDIIKIKMMISNIEDNIKRSIRRTLGVDPYC